MRKDKREKYERRRVKSSYVSVVVSTTLVLFILGLIGMLVLSTDNLTRHIKENFAVGVALKDGVKQQDLDQCIRAIEVAPYAKGVQFVSREDALQTLKDDLGEDFVEFVGDNPLNDRIDVFFRAEYADSRQVDSVATMLMKNDFVDSVDYNRIMLDEINSNIRTISLWLGAFAILFLVVSILLINNSVRLPIYSKRFTIRTMQLVGATPKFIRRPFVNRLVGSALISAFIALILLSGIVYYLYQWQPEYRIVLDLRLIGALYCGLVVISVLITMISGRTAVRKFLGMRAEDLYY